MRVHDAQSMHASRACAVRVVADGDDPTSLLRRDTHAGGVWPLPAVTDWRAPAGLLTDHGAERSNASPCVATLGRRQALRYHAVGPVRLRRWYEREVGAQHRCQRKGCIAPVATYHIASATEWISAYRTRTEGV